MWRLRFPLLPALLRWAGAIAVAAIIVYFSLLTTPPAKPVDPSIGAFWDKKLHLVAYGTLGLSLIYATAARRGGHANRVPLSIGVAVVLGVSVELIQGPLPERYFSLADMLANALGALLASGWFLIETRLEYVPFSR